jgi:hypothetical protein
MDRALMTRTVRITLRGSLNDRFATVFDGMTPVRGAGTTALVGPIADQAQLHGLLERIRDFGLELESVELSPLPATTEEGINVGAQSSRSTG